MMRGILLLALLCAGVYGQGLFVPPPASVSVLEGVKFQGSANSPMFTDRFKECDSKNICNGKILKCSGEPNHNSVLLKLKGGVIFFDAKMSLDLDGSAYSKKTPGRSDQPDTSLRYPLTGRPSIDSDRVPYIVLPEHGFETALALHDGDVAAVIYKGRRVYAVVGDQGPVCKIGEGSLRLHEALGHMICAKRAANGDCLKPKDSGLDKDVLYFIFPGTHRELLEGLTPDNINARIAAIGAEAWRKLTEP